MRALGLALTVGIASVTGFALSKSGSPALAPLRGAWVRLTDSILEGAAFARPVTAHEHGGDRAGPTSTHGGNRALALVAHADSARAPELATQGPRVPGAATPVPSAPEFALVSTAKETVVYARPSMKAPKLGYLRSGA